ncbi:hypothetical protein CC86DRAFT_373693 [Ophiobolus disseminans]|uniref:Uncharacterized protein n=1 Tax=Ophiobolus disseminans TaxID=1469910 RepID=A0A6A6ZJX3_9PLEO|nr:hypothetical protein CC86DRAFT_373693 [Ophiobolus disseminans]
MPFRPSTPRVAVVCKRLHELACSLLYERVVIHTKKICSTRPNQSTSNACPLSNEYTKELVESFRSAALVILELKRRGFVTENAYDDYFKHIKEAAEAREEVDYVSLIAALEASPLLFMKKALRYARLLFYRFVAILDLNTLFLFEFEDDRAEGGKLWVVPNKPREKSIRSLYFAFLMRAQKAAPPEGWGRR